MWVGFVARPCHPSMAVASCLRLTIPCTFPNYSVPSLLPVPCPAEFPTVLPRLFFLCLAFFCPAIAFLPTCMCPKHPSMPAIYHLLPIPPAFPLLVACLLVVLAFLFLLQTLVLVHAWQLPHLCFFPSPPLNPNPGTGNGRKMEMLIILKDKQWHNDMI